MGGSSSEKFCLRWNDFESNISRAFRELRDDRDFFDVTLLADGADEVEEVQAHKVILSACSPFFRNVLRRKSTQNNTLLYLKGVKHTDLMSVLNFMYHGEVNVAQDDLNSFLAVAEDLQVKGLTQNNAGHSSTGNSSSLTKASGSESKHSLPSGSSSFTRGASSVHSTGGKSGSPRVSSGGEPPVKRARPGPSSASGSGGGMQSITEDDDDIQEVVPVKSEPKEMASSITAVQSTSQVMQETSHYEGDDGSSGFQDNQQLARQDELYEEGYDDYSEEFDEQYIAQANPADGDKGLEGVDLASMQAPDDLLAFCERNAANCRYECTICRRFSHRGRHQVRNHVESRHFPSLFKYQCPHCPSVLNSKKSLENHLFKRQCTAQSNSGF